MRLLLAMSCLLLAVSGCAMSRVTPVCANPVRIPPMPRDFVWEQVVDVVDDYFDIDREERGRVIGDVVTVGRIDTFPAVGSTLLEPWRGDSVTAYDRLESTLQSIRRRAVVQVIPAEDGSVLIDVAVFKELEDVPRPEGAPVASATFRYDQSLQRFSEPVGGQPVPLGWIGVGRDCNLEKKMISQIVARLNPQAYGWTSLFYR